MEDIFKESFKFYKSKNQQNFLTDVLDFTNVERYQQITELNTINRSEPACDVCDRFGLKYHNQWKLFTTHNNEGLLFLPSIFTPKGQNIWIQRCVEEFPKKPNLTNIDSILEAYKIDDVWLNHINNPSKLIKKLRWATFGYHHDWDLKIYNEYNRSEFPGELEIMIKHIAEVIGFSPYNPEAAIVNYYDLSSTISGHVDYSEYDLSSPIFSFSFGQSAIFLIGGATKSVRPSAMLLRSGDLVVMSGESRGAYHAVPRILQCEDTPWETENMSPSLKEYIASTRININARQVFPIKNSS